MVLDHFVDLSVLIVNWNTRDLLLQCLQSIYATVLDITFEVIVVDNASSDGSAQAVKKSFPQAHWIQNPTNLGFASANNQAISISGGRYIVLLNSDTQVRHGVFARAVAFMDCHPEAGIVGGILLNPDGSFQASYNDDPTLFSELLLCAGVARWLRGKYYPSHSPRESQEAHPVDWVGGACLLARRDVIDQVGLLDPTYFLYSEELDWCSRFRRAGWKVYFLPDLQVIHWGGQSSQAIEERRLYWLTGSRLRFLAKHHNGLLLVLLRTVLRMIAIVKAFVWVVIAFLSRGRRRSAWVKVRANWLLARWDET
jgi:N-acetylglucosaminyl-diphospho-decaprenol L-rhamnosyltransferase